MLLHSNQLDSTLPSELGLVRRLTILTVHDTSLSGSIPSEIGALAKNASLQEFSFTDTMLTGSLPPEFCTLPFLFFNCTGVLCGCGCPCDRSDKNSTPAARWLMVRVCCSVSTIANIFQVSLRYRKPTVARFWLLFRKFTLLTVALVELWYSNYCRLLATGECSHDMVGLSLTNSNYSRLFHEFLRATGGYRAARIRRQDRWCRRRTVYSSTVATS